MVEFKFHFGKEKRSIYDWVQMGVVLNFSIEVLSSLPWFTRKGVFNYVDSIQLKGKHDFLNEYIINDREFLSYRMERVLNKALKEYISNG